MNTVTIEEAKQNLEQLVEKAAQGQPFLIAEPGKPRFEIVATQLPESPVKRSVGFLEGQFKVPDDFDTMGMQEIQNLFEGTD